MIAETECPANLRCRPVAGSLLGTVLPKGAPPAAGPDPDGDSGMLSHAEGSVESVLLYGRPWLEPPLDPEVGQRSDKVMARKFPRSSCRR
jgi:hypothetical protein